ncbi:MAG TPA: alginate lyase family protein [Terriglobales bacterium]|nr:alginate lyase family protein [Terriglobales bacterium]
MASGWQSKLTRISRMDWAEIRVRARQEFHKQSDLLLHGMGVRAGALRLNSDRAARQGQFFFPASEGSERAELVRKQLPDEATEILREADEICSHRFRLLGYENLAFDLADGSVGRNNLKDIDWHLDPVHRKRAPLDPWFKIPFLDFALVGDHKITWELNRHQHLVTLAKARLLSGDQKYVRELIAQWHGWIKANPYPLGINWGSTLEVAFRSLSWIWVDQMLAGMPEYAQFRAELVPALAFHGRYIERYLSTYFSPNTHLLGEVVALFFLGTLYPQMPGAARWKESGWKIVLHEAARQVRPDGVYFEQSLYYHVYALDFFLYARLLAARNGMAIPPAYDAVLGRMLDVVAALAQAGPVEGFGDDDGGRLWNPRRNRTEQMTDPLALGAVMYAKDFAAARLTEEAIWLFGNKAVEKLSPVNTTPQASPAARSLAFPDGGIYVLADSQPHAQAMVVDAGPQGVGRSGHGHADALSLRLTMDGRRWLVDAGSGVYISKDAADRDTFRGTGAHNTVRVDELDQAIANEPFSWTHLPTTHAENWVAGKSFTYFVGSHDGYARLADPVLHRRHVLKIAGGLWLVRDVALGRSEHELEIRWHFAPDLEVRVVGPGRVEVRVSTAGAASGASGLRLIVPEETVWHTGTEVSRTLLSPAYGAFEPAPLVRCHARVLLPAETATALVPRSGPISPEDEPRLASMAQSAVQVYELDSHDESQGFFFALGDEAWSFGPWSSDARVLYCRIENERLAHLVVIGGKHVAFQGQPLLTAAGPFAFFEWRRQDAVMNAAPGSVSVTSLFEKLTGDSPSVSAGLNHGSSKPGSSKPGSSNRSPSPYAEKH